MSTQPTPTEIQQMIEGDLKMLGAFANAVMLIFPKIKFRTIEDDLNFDVEGNTNLAFEIMKLADAYNLAFVLRTENRRIILSVY